MASWRHDGKRNKTKNKKKGRNRTWENRCEGIRNEISFDVVYYVGRRNDAMVTGQQQHQRKKKKVSLPANSPASPLSLPAWKKNKEKEPLNENFHFQVLLQRNTNLTFKWPSGTTPCCSYIHTSTSILRLTLSLSAGATAAAAAVSPL